MFPNKEQRFSPNWEYFTGSFLTGTDYPYPYPYLEGHPS